MGFVLSAFFCYIDAREVQAMADKRQLNEHYAEIAQDLINTEDVLSYIRDAQVSIVYLSSEFKKMENGRKVCAVCEKVDEKFKWSIPADYTITVFEPNVAGMNEDQIRILLFHELLHIHIDYADGEEKYSINGHDIEDFRYIIDRFGSDWDKVTDEDPMIFRASVKIDLGAQVKQNLDHLNRIETDLSHVNQFR